VKLVGDEVLIDRSEYHLRQLGKILGILVSMAG